MQDPEGKKELRVIAMEECKWGSKESSQQWLQYRGIARGKAFAHQVSLDRGK